MARFPYFGFPYQYPYYRYYNRNTQMNSNYPPIVSSNSRSDETSSIKYDSDIKENTEENFSSVKSNRSYSKTKSNKNSLFSFNFNGFLNSDNPIINILGIDLYLDDIMILCLLFILYKEEIKDEMLFIALILLLLS